MIHPLTDEERRFLKAVEVYGRPAYGIEIYEHLLANGIDMTTRRIYPVLRDLERRGLLESAEDGKPPERGGRPRRYYTVTSLGLEALQRAVVVHAPSAPSFWKRALRKVLPGGAIQQLLYRALGEVDPKTLRAVLEATSKEESFENALNTALRTAFTHTQQDPGGETDLGSGASTKALPDGHVKTKKGATAAVPLSDLVAFNERLRSLGNENEDLRAENARLRASASAGPRVVKIALRDEHDVSNDVYRQHVYLTMSDGAIVEVDYEGHCKNLSCAETLKDSAFLQTGDGRRWLAEYANRAPDKVLVTLSQEPKGLDWIDIS